MDPVILFGHNDRNLESLEKSCGVSLVARGDKVTVDGPEESIRLVSGLLSTVIESLRRDPDLSDEDVQALLRQVEKDQLAMALKGGSDDIKDLFFKNMSERAAKMMQEDMEAMGPVRLKEVDEAQGNVVQTAQTLADAGEIVISGGGEEDELVF